MDWSIEEAVTYYRRQGAPGDQTALVNLLREIMKEKDALSHGDLHAVAEAFGLKQTYLLAIIRRFPGLRLQDRHTLEICAGPNCGKCRELCDYGETIKESGDGRISVSYVPCMRMCGKGPNIRWDGTVYHRADVALLKRLTGNE